MYKEYLLRYPFYSTTLAIQLLDSISAQDVKLHKKVKFSAFFIRKIQHLRYNKNFSFCFFKTTTLVILNQSVNSQMVIKALFVYGYL